MITRRGILRGLASLPLLTLPGSGKALARVLQPRQALTDAGPWLRQQIASAPGFFQLAPGIYTIGVVPHDRNPNYWAGFFLPSGFKLVGSGRGNTIIQLLPGQPNHAFIGLNKNFDIGGDGNIEVEGLTFDGNAAAQGTLDAQVGLSLWRAEGVSIRHCAFKNVYGTTSGANGPLGTNGEGTHCDLTTCSHAMIEDCYVVGGAQTATGFSLTSCTDVAYVNSAARGCAHAQGFTGYQSAGLSYTNCQSVGNGVCGFNCELSTDARYLGCLAGGTASTYGNEGLYAPGQLLGNGATGFNVRGSTQVELLACTSSHNGGHGVAFYYNHPSGLRIVGGQMQNNMLWGVYTDAGATDALLVGTPDISGNGSGQSTI